MLEPNHDVGPIVVPHLVVSNATNAIRFYQRALGATEIYRVSPRRGHIARAELAIGECRVMVSDELPGSGARSARSLGGSPIVLTVYAADVDALARRFVMAGGIILQALQVRLYGDRSGQFRDPEGYCWTLSQHLERVSPEEIARRMITPR